MQQCGIYEQLITQLLASRLDRDRFYVGERQLDPSEAAVWLSRFLSRIKIDNVKMSFNITEQYKKELEALYHAKVWMLRDEIVPIEQMPLGEDLVKAMEKLKQLHAVYAELPHLDCGTCGRPSCRVMAEDIVRGEGSLDDCIFRLKSRIADLSREIYELSKRLVHTMTPEGK